MRVCVVGQGPSAHGKGKAIDACDFVVRLRAFWRTAADDAGEKISAHAVFDGRGILDVPPLACERWFTHCPEQVFGAHDVGRIRLRAFVENARFRVCRMMTDMLWAKLVEYLSAHPSTGMAAASMAIEAFPGCELVLYGFDSTTPDRPNYWDARNAKVYEVFPHNMLAEKRALAEIGQGIWLGNPTTSRLCWPDMPDIGPREPVQ